MFITILSFIDYNITKKVVQDKQFPQKAIKLGIGSIMFTSGIGPFLKYFSMFTRFEKSYGVNAFNLMPVK